MNRFARHAGIIVDRKANMTRRFFYTQIFNRIAGAFADFRYIIQV